MDRSNSPENNGHKDSPVCARAGSSSSLRSSDATSDTPVASGSSEEQLVSTADASSLNDNGVQVLTTPEDIAVLLECPICYNTLLPPVTLCRAGHSICADCKKKLQFCPLCRGFLTEIRNRTLEEILDKCMAACRYRDFGCTVVLPAYELSTHHKTCQCAPDRVAAVANDLERTGIL